MSRDHLRSLAAYFRRNPKAVAAYLHEDASAHAEPAAGSSVAYHVSRDHALPHAVRGAWQAQLDFLDQLDAEDAAWKAAWS